MEPYALSEVLHRKRVVVGRMGKPDEVIPLRVWVKWPESWKEVTGCRWETRKGRKTPLPVLVLETGSLMELDRSVGTESFAVRAAAMGQ
jgi:hypothetical protein